MKKNLILGVLFVVLCAVLLAQLPLQHRSEPSGSTPSSSPSQTSSSVIQPKEMHAVWFSYLDWNNHFKGKSEQDFSASAEQVVNCLASIDCNTIFLHLRAFGDAMYPSAYFPWSSSCSGTIGQAPGYDPLKIFIEKAHAKGIAVHGWVNPLRTMTEQDFSAVDLSFQTKAWYHAEDSYRYYMIDGTGRAILIPANPAVRALIVDGIKELVSAYDLDGIHFDDYFYPAGVDDFSQSDQAYYAECSTGIPVDQWRRDSVSALVSEVYQAVKEINPKVEFGISPQSSVDANYQKYYADLKLWVQTDGYLDYIAPQIYFGFQNSAQPFEETAALWNDLVDGSGTTLYIGLACYKIGLDYDQHAGEGQGEWQAVAQTTNDMLKRQIGCIEQLPNCAGYCLYDYKSIFQTNGEFQPVIQAEMDHLLHK